jgi:6-phospho-beta-glucosidase
MYIKNNLNNIPFYIAENGMGVENENRFRNQKSKEIQDNYRIAFLQEHLEQLHKAIKDGANCFGYHM